MSIYYVEPDYLELDYVNDAPPVAAIDSDDRLENIQNILLTRAFSKDYSNIWYWDPFNGDDLNPGNTADKGFKTFATTQIYANPGDLILALATNPAGLTSVDEAIAVVIPNLLIRGPGRALHLQNSNDIVSTLSIEATGVEVSGMRISSSAANTVGAVKVSVDNTHLTSLWLAGVKDGIILDGATHTVLDTIEIVGATGNGLTVAGVGSQMNEIRNSLITGSEGDGIQINTGVGVGHFSIKNGTTVTRSLGVGVNILNSSYSTIIQDDSVIHQNTGGNISDNGVLTYNNTGDLGEIEFHAFLDSYVNKVDWTDGNDFDSLQEGINEIRVVVDALDNFTEPLMHLWLDSYSNKDNWKAAACACPTKEEIANMVWTTDLSTIC